MCPSVGNYPLVGRNGKNIRNPIDEFGIVAAMTSSGIIGVNGRLPWDYLPTDRKIFERLTRNRILIIGRRTLLEENHGDLSHVRHAKCCIVVSKTISSLDKEPTLIKNKTLDNGDIMRFLKLVRSFDEALDLARILSEEIDDDGTKDDKTTALDNDRNNCDDENNTVIPNLFSSSKNIRCWVVGGSRLYEGALQHKSAKELHLSVVDAEIDLVSIAIENVVRFPTKCQWEDNYEIISVRRFPSSSSVVANNQNKKREPSFAYLIYQRIGQ